MPILSIIIVSYNTRQLLSRCLDSILKDSNEYVYEIIVVDNNSNDGSQAYLKEKYPNILLLLNDENKGFGRANNQAAKLAKGDFLLFLNSDTEVLDNALEKMVKFAKTNPLKTIGGKLLNSDLSPQKSCGPFFSIPVIIGMLFLKGDYFGFTRYSPEKVQKVDWVSGACLLVKRDIFIKSGGFDEGIFMYMEEVEYLKRLKKEGYQTVFYPDAKFIHIGGGSNLDKQEPVLHIYKGLQFLYKKHYGKSDQIILALLLKIKAWIAIFIGSLIQKRELVSTYKKAYASISS